MYTWLRQSFPIREISPELWPMLGANNSPKRWQTVPQSSIEAPERSDVIENCSIPV